MNRDKQIEELTAELIKTNSYGTLNAVASHLYNAGYRKASEFAREIFDAVWRNVIIDIPEYSDCRKAFNELKKKYTEDGE